MRKSEYIFAALGLIVAALALIPAFGQWLFPREPVPVVNTATPTPLPPTLEATPINTPTTTPTAIEVPPPPATSPTPTVVSPTNSSPTSLIAPECEAAQYRSIELPLSPLIAFNLSDPQLREDAQLAKELVVLSMMLAIQASADQNPRCLREIFAGAALGDVESTIANVSSTGVVSVPWIEWGFSQMREVYRRDSQRIEAGVCLYQSLNVYSTLGVLIASYPADMLAATYVFEQVEGGGRYYVTAIGELDPFTYCQF